MRSFLLRRSGWRSLQIACIAFSFIVLILAWGITLQRLDADKALAMESASKQQNNLAIIIAENFRQLLDGAHTISIVARDWWDGFSPAEVDRLTAMRGAHSAFLNISLYDVRARRLYSSSPAADTPWLIAAVYEAFQSVTTVNSTS